MKSEYFIGLGEKITLLLVLPFKDRKCRLMQIVKKFKCKVETHKKEKKKV